MIGKLLKERYKIIKTLGIGGFGHTYLAEAIKSPGSPVCVVKQLKPLNTLPEQLAKAKVLFEREAEKLVQLGRHDQIPELLDYFSDENDLFLVQEYIEGHTLETELQSGQVWPEQQVIQLLLDLLPVLTFIHNAGMLHRDIKPPNIMRRQKDNKLVLIDFGAVKEVQAQMGQAVPSTVATGTVIGTQGYMPSEQAQGKSRPCSDLYALGIICIQALTGKMPSQLDDDVDTGELVWQHLVQASPELKQVLKKITRDYFVDRYQSATEVLQALQCFRPSSSTSPTASYGNAMRDEAPKVSSTHERKNNYLPLIIGGIALIVASTFFVINSFVGQGPKNSVAKSAISLSKILDSESNLCLDIVEDKDAEPVILQPCSQDSQSSQAWTLQGDSIKHVKSGRCLDVAGNRVGGPVVIHSCYPTLQNTFQTWSVNSGKLLNLKSQLCLDASKNKALTKAILDDCQGEIHKFKILPIK
jgi:serine/threonine protein kinase